MSEAIGDTFTLDDGTVMARRACERCNDETWNAHLCRDFKLAHLFALMTCSVCKRMHTVTEGQLGEFADGLWGDDHRCTCDPKPPTLETEYIP